ncbi:RagB/SusD family nutrient uptake outer membrane protein [Massilibacteroides sp.]|uniref:RagB/SusD family nutrient uptake outer membrane protein n=1 Tax=Massilibacteroides sp. TaxID=2034766 RepID=UPI00263422A7|nr:RagB/SusD family nutrient uptake outer membrane protein [Massilibacteroides sp.]MDD4516030.1 RagB/SusD family nutrient uptake outer membrane protein [Massilibacteroides sp.]
MKKYIIYIGFLSILTSFGCEDYLSKEPLDKLTNENFWVNETNLRSYSQDFYVTYFEGYAQDYRLFGGYFSGDSYNDDFMLSTATGTDRAQRFYFPATNTSAPNNNVVWKKQYEMLRKANIMLEKIPTMNIEESAKQHWTGVGRFFRALAHSTLVKEFGDIPAYDIAPGPDQRDLLYKDRDSRTSVVDMILEDFDYAVENVRADDGTLQVNKYVVGAFMSRWMLFHGTWAKYHGTTVGTSSNAVDNATIKRYLEGAIKGSNVVINSGNFKIGNTYNALFSSESLAGNPEIVFYREYVSGLSHNALLAYNAKEDQELGGVGKDLIDSYLCVDGLPISQSPLYKGKNDPSVQNSFQERDPRLYDTFVDSLRIMNSGLHSATSPTGYVSKKFLNEKWLADNESYITGLLSPVDAPVIRYAEVLLNYVEARYEVSLVGGEVFTQNDLDISINRIRQRQLTKWGETPSVTRSLPQVTLAGNALSVNGVIINDPQRDIDIDPVLWEIRRERRIELVMEGRRSADLNRWAKYEYLNTQKNGQISDIVLGAWIKKSDYPGINSGVKLYNPDGDETKEGYIAFYYYTGDKTAHRSFVKGELNSERNYLRAVPLTEINKYSDAGYTIGQNPGWE